MATGRSNFDTNRLGYMAGGAGAMGAGLAQMLAPWDNPYEAGQNTLNETPGIIKPYFDPYIQAGNRALPSLESNFNQLTSSPGGMMNKIGGDFHQSPGYNFALKQALQAAGNTEAARGMLYSPEHTQMAEQTAIGLADQDYYNWLGHALNLYGTGLEGQQGLYKGGMGAAGQLGENLGNINMSKAIQQILSQQAENEHDEAGLGAFMGGGASALAAFAGGG